MARKQLPRPCYHKGQQRWYVTLDGTEHYLGGKMARSETPPPAVQSEYDSLMASWLAARALPPERLGSSPSIAEAWLSYLAHCRQTYSRGEVQSVTDACKVLAALFGLEAMAAFTPAKLRQLRDRFLEMGWARDYCNKQVSRVRRLFAWAVVEGLVGRDVWLGLKALPGLRVSKKEQRERQVEEVSDELIEATLPRLPERVRVMVRLHRLIGCRAQEIVCMRTCDLDLEADPDEGAARCWLYTPPESKTHERYWVGPKAQALLRPLLNPAEPTAYLFPTRRRGKGCWTTSSYRRLIDTACKGGKKRVGRAYKHNVKWIELPELPHWSPLQIRHAAAEEARRRHPRGLEATQARLRHARMETSEIYAHELDQLGRDVARQLG